MTAYNDLSNEYTELKSMLEKFTVAVLKKKPNNLLRFTVNYFQNLERETEKERNQLDLSDHSMDDDYDSEDDIMSYRKAIMMLKNVSDAPRESVVGETFNPSQITDEEFEKSRKIFPKTQDQLSKIRELVKPIFIFQSLDEVQLEKVIDSMFFKEIYEGEVIIRENDRGDNFYVIDRGTYYVFNNEKTISETYKDEGFFGELALLYNSPRKATVKAKSDGALWVIDRKSFTHLILKSAYNKRMKLEGLIKKVKILEELSDYDRSNLADALKSKIYSNEIIIKEGDLGKSMYFINEGEVIVTQKDGLKEKEVKRLKSGDYFGEVALIAKIPRIASVHAVGIVKVEELDVESYERLMGPCIDVMRSNIKKYSNQLTSLLTTEQMQTLFPDITE